VASVFSRFAPRLQEAIVARLGWSSLRPVQELAGEALLAGHNAVILAPTAGGKTEASFFPLLSDLVERPPQALAALYIAPIKALLNNQAERLGLYTEMVGLDRFVWHGDTSSAARKRFLREPASVLMTTPESLEVMLVSQGVDDAKLFADLRTVIIDEVHAFAGSDRGAHLMSVLERLAVRSEHDLQRIGLSATVGNPPAILDWLSGTSERPGRVVDPPKVPGRKQLMVQCCRSSAAGLNAADEGALAAQASELARGHKTLLFCQARATTELYATEMRRLGTTVHVHHSAISHEERQAAEEQFHRGSDACIVCTSTLELGIDVGDLDHVLQAEAPPTVNSFLQRMGRTGRRANQPMRMSFFCLNAETVLQAAALIELAKGRWVEPVLVQDRCWSVLIHQLLTMALASDGVAPEAAWHHLSRVPDFRGVTRGEFDRLLQWMQRDRGLDIVSGHLVLGPKAERRFGRRNFMDLYAVFSSPTAYAVVDAAGKSLGTLQQSFVDRLAEGVSCFLLGGRAWVATRIDHSARQVMVMPAPRGKKPQWGGYLPQFLGFEVCQAMRRLLLSDDEPGYLTEEAKGVLREQRELFGVLRLGNRAIEYDASEIRWWTFAGGKINKTLAYALEACCPDWKVVTDNRLVSVRGEAAERERFDDALEQLGEAEFWEDEQLWREIACDLPNYRLSKFQSLMPAWVVRETVAAYLLDMEGTWRWLSGRGAAPRPVEPVVEDRATSPLSRHSGSFPRPTLPVRWVETQADLVEVCAELGKSRVVALDVETTRTQALCVVQMANDDFITVIDARAIADLGPIAALLGDDSVVKVIHFASFERSVFRRHGVEIANVFDTCKESRQQRAGEKKHTLAAVCARELGVQVDKGEQMSNWARRPLTESQFAYAALDAEVLLSLHRVFAPGRLI